ncbi:hypothetical protein N483_18050 [Pseudoalteromonas luteoviolacea NCIMB 1944]|nr:hypothetical protein N483_18050 [Pseudoalteromonas luteoviolacea NCIMB 1944]
MVIDFKANTRVITTKNTIIKIKIGIQYTKKDSKICFKSNRGKLNTTVSQHFLCVQITPKTGLFNSSA